MVWENVRYVPENVFVKFVATNKKLFVNVISQWENKTLVWEIVRYIPEKVCVNFVATDKKLFVNAISQWDNKI